MIDTTHKRGFQSLIDKNFKKSPKNLELNTNVQNDPKEEAEYAKILSTDYTKTPLARANPSAKVRSFTGAWPIPSEMPVSLRNV